MTIRERLRALPSLAGPFPAFDPATAPEEPVALFLEWFDEAVASGVGEPHATVLSTVDAEGRPDARVLILKEVDSEGWRFASTRAGPKGRQIAARPHVALTTYWQSLGRQVRIRGIAAEMEREAGRADFLDRSMEARAIALTARQSEVLSEISDAEEAVARQRLHLTAAPDTVAPDWTLYAVRPLDVEFWQGSADRRHIRLAYHRTEGGWRRTLLWP